MDDNEREAYEEQIKNLTDQLEKAMGSSAKH
jgi:hypothetical protein